MRINELIVENQQIDELSLAGVGKGVGNVIRGTSSAVQGAKGAWQGAKDAWNQGTTSGTYDKARAAVSGIPTNQAAQVGPQPVTQPAAAPAATTPTTTTAPAATVPAQATTTTAPTGTAPAAPVQQPVTVRQINQAIPTLRKRDLTSVKNTVDATVARKMPAPTAAPAQQAPAENPNIVQGTNENFKSNFLGMMI
jgi:hypothetical protein